MNRLSQEPRTPEDFLKIGMIAVIRAVQEHVEEHTLTDCDDSPVVDANLLLALLLQLLVAAEGSEDPH